MENLNTKSMVLKETGNPVIEQSEANGLANTAGLILLAVFIGVTTLIAGKYALGIRDGEKRNGKVYIDSEENPALGNEDKKIHHFVPNDPTMTRVR